MTPAQQQQLARIIQPHLALATKYNVRVDFDEETQELEIIQQPRDNNSQYQAWLYWWCPESEDFIFLTSSYFDNQGQQS